RRGAPHRPSLPRGRRAQLRRAAGRRSADAPRGVLRSGTPHVRARRPRAHPSTVAGRVRRRRVIAPHDRPAHARGLRLRRDRDGVRPQRGVRASAARCRRGRGPRPHGERVLARRRRRRALSAHAAHGADRRGPVSGARALVLLSLALVAFRLASAALVVVQPGFTDAFYYASVARRLAHGEGLTADFVWNFIEAPNFAPLPVPSHRFWMPLTSVVQAVGIVALEPALGTFRAAQAAIVAVGAFVPAAAYLAALATGGAWLARGVSLGASPDLMGRTALLARYEDFFAIRPTGTADLATAVGVRVAALASDLGLVVISLVLFLVVPLALALRARWRLPAVRAFAGLALLLYLVESLVWTLHATRGSYFHSLAALFPFAMALAAVGGEIFFAARAPGLARVAVAGTLGASSILALFALALWGSTYNASYKARSAALDAIPPGPFLAIDATAAYAAALGPDPEPRRDDQVQYLALARGLIERGEFTRAGAGEPFVPEPLRFPGYPLLLAAVCRTVGCERIVAVQAVLL